MLSKDKVFLLIRLHSTGLQASVHAQLQDQIKSLESTTETSVV